MLARRHQAVKGGEAINGAPAVRINDGCVSGGDGRLRRWREGSGLGGLGITLGSTKGLILQLSCRRGCLTCLLSGVAYDGCPLPLRDALPP